jgi:hypothetical protein
MDIACPKCKSKDTLVDSLLFQGIHTLADTVCKACGFKFYHCLPIGHDLLFPIQVSKDGKESFFHPRAKDWLAAPLIKSLGQKPEKRFPIERKVYKDSKQVVIVNCLDNCFGHIFTKVWNTYKLIKSRPELGVIAIIPQRCNWLVPRDIAEIWSVPVELKDSAQMLGGLDEFVKSQLTRFDKVYLSHTFTHLDHTRHIAMEEILKTSRFDLDTFCSSTPQVTFVLREDRFWLNSQWMDFLFKASKKFKLTHWIFPILAWRQRQLVKRTGKKIRQSLPNVLLNCTGLGKSGKLLEGMADYRTDMILPETEFQWNSIFAKSHVVIGVHGSHMLIPSALAAGFVNIVPRFKIEHMVEDTALPYKNRLLHFLGRFLDEYSTSSLVSMHVVRMISDFDYVNNNLKQHQE